MNPDFSLLPYEVQFNYLLYLPLVDISDYCSVNNDVKAICIDDYFWKAKMDHDFPGVSEYKQEYLDLIAIPEFP